LSVVTRSSQLAVNEHFAVCSPGQLGTMPHTGKTRPESVMSYVMCAPLTVILDIG